MGELTLELNNATRCGHDTPQLGSRGFAKRNRGPRN
jgi:hypothetical protein